MGLSRSMNSNVKKFYHFLSVHFLGSEKKHMKFTILTNGRYIIQGH